MPDLASEIVARLDALPVHNAEPVRQLRREYSRRLTTASADDVLAVAEQLLEPPTPHMRRFIAYELIACHGAASGALDGGHVERLAADMADWGGVDMFSCYLAGPTWRAGRLDDARVQRWARSDSRWWRRAALVSTTALNARGTRGDAERTLAIAQLLQHDRDDMVVKGLSWALRELSKRDPHAVSAFLAQHELAPRVRREVTNKLETGLKTPTGRRTRSLPRPA